MIHGDILKKDDREVIPLKGPLTKLFKNIKKLQKTRIKITGASTKWLVRMIFKMKIYTIQYELLCQ